MVGRQQDALEALGESEIAAFRERGFLVVERLIDGTRIEALRGRFGPLFRGEFDTGIYPDEWYWREGMSLPDATRHMANAWKSDLAVAALVTEPSIARAAARLAGWRGTRLGQDTLWWKPPETRPIALHQDSSFIDFLVPDEMVTCWVTLDDTAVDAGTIEYVPGSHRWTLAGRPLDFHTPEGGYRAKMAAAARTAGVASPEIVPIEVPAGSCVFHHGRIWHGSGPNVSSGRVRRSIGIHLLPEEVRFGPAGGGYIYGRYRRVGDDRLDESFFPVLWDETGSRRTPWIGTYLRTGRPEGPASPDAG